MNARKQPAIRHLAGHGRLLFGSLALMLGLVSCAEIPGDFPPPGLPPPEASPQIFASYRAHRDSQLADGWTRGFDMSGIAFDEDRTATLITPRHVVMAAHFARPTSTQVVFHDRYGKRVKRTIIGLAPGKGDVMIGLLDEDVPANYRAYPLPAPEPDFSRLVGRPVLVTDQNRCLFIHRIAGAAQGWIQFRHDPEKKYGWGKNLVVGDSGNPSFLIVGNELVLIETHTTGGPGAGPFFGDPDMQSAIRAAVSMLGGGQHIRTVPIR